MAIVTVGSTGLGKAAREVLASEGGRLLVTDIEDKLGRATVGEIKGPGYSADYYRLDVTSEDQVAPVWRLIDPRLLRSCEGRLIPDGSIVAKDKPSCGGSPGR